MAAVISLSKIVKNLIIKRSYPVHYYIRLLVFAKDALRELSFDLPILPARYRCLSVDTETSTAELPNDFVDKIRVSARVGQYIVPLVEDTNLQTIPNYNSDFQVQPYSEGVQVPDAQATSGYGYYNSSSGYAAPYSWLVNWNSWGENIGRRFGGVTGYSDTYKINKLDNNIKINENLDIQEIVLEYISNGMDADSATHIDAYAQMAIEKFCMWQFKEHNRTYSEGEAQVALRDYQQELAVLRARLNPMTLDELKRIVDRSRSATKPG
jgi:hypothetical protein